MYYLIHAPNHPRPYVSTVSFIANDFAAWGCRVTCHAKHSAYITEVRYQENRNRPGTRRIELMEVWAKEVLARKQQQPQPQSTANPAAATNKRKERASGFAQDFIGGLSAFESPVVAPKSLPNDPLPLPEYPFALAAKYTRLVHRCAYTSCAALPAWADPEVFIADQITLDFRFDKGLKREQLAAALNEAISKRTGRMGRMEKCAQTGLTRILMWIDVSDLLARESKDGEDPVPIYERGEWMWPPRYEDCVC